MNERYVYMIAGKDVAASVNLQCRAGINACRLLIHRNAIPSSNIYYPLSDICFVILSVSEGSHILQN
jgi:hypothetical protein